MMKRTLTLLPSLLVWLTVAHAAEPSTGKRTGAAANEPSRPIGVLLGANLVANPGFKAHGNIPEGWYFDAGADALRKWEQKQNPSIQCHVAIRCSAAAPPVSWAGSMR
jgi:hypothetical protein